jgi:drug/metabolite transporter (DMT)-like permease
MRLGAPPAKVWAALAVIYVVWGSTYLAIDVGVRTMPPMVMLAVRFLVAGALLYVVVAAREGRLLRPPALAEWRSALVIGAALMLVGNGSVGWAENRDVDTGTAAIIIATVPLWLALFDRLLHGRRLTGTAVLGLAVGFAGVAILVSPAGSGAGAAPLAELVLVCSSAVWALGSLRARGSTGSSPLLSAAMQMLCGGVLLALAGLVAGEWNDVDVSAVSGASLAGLAYLIVVGSLLAFSAYTWLLRVAPTSLVGTYAYVNPLIAVLLGTVFLGEGLTWRLLVGGGIVVAAVAVIVTGARAPRRTAVASAPARAK